MNSDFLSAVQKEYFWKPGREADSFFLLLSGIGRETPTTTCAELFARIPCWFLCSDIVGSDVKCRISTGRSTKLNCKQLLTFKIFKHSGYCVKQNDSQEY